MLGYWLSADFKACCARWLLGANRAVQLGALYVILNSMKAEQPTVEGVDKSSWGLGPWQDEPDRVDFIHSGFACFAKRGPLGQWCGYVGVPRESPLYGKPYHDVNFDVHGGLTYADKCDGEICHAPEPGMPDDVWWLGFDCAHSGDLVPGMEAFRRKASFPSPDWETYKDLAYVSSQIRSLAEQLAALPK